MVTCCSTSITPAQKNYSTIELELSAIVYALTNAKHFPIGTPENKVKSNHFHLMNHAEKHWDEIPNARLLRRFEKIITYNHKIIAIPGTHKKITDFLSKFP